MFIISPLEQFTIIPWIIISKININLWLLWGLIILILYNIKPFLLIEHFKWLNNEINNIKDHIFIIFSILIIILGSNLLGMLPYSLTLTAHLIFVWSISIVIFISINMLGIKIHKFNITYLFLPSGVPIYLVPIISIIEFFLYFTRVISLTLRLSANMLAGHILMKILIYSFFNLPLLSLLIIPILFLELLVAFLQSYVYIVLIISYYNDISITH